MSGSGGASWWPGWLSGGSSSTGESKASKYWLVGGLVAVGVGIAAVVGVTQHQKKRKKKKPVQSQQEHKQQRGETTKETRTTAAPTTAAAVVPAVAESTLAAQDSTHHRNLGLESKHRPQPLASPTYPVLQTPVDPPALAVTQVAVVPPVTSTSSSNSNSTSSNNNSQSSHQDESRDMIRLPDGSLVLRRAQHLSDSRQEEQTETTVTTTTTTTKSTLRRHHTDEKVVDTAHLPAHATGYTPQPNSYLKYVGLLLVVCVSVMCSVAGLSSTLLPTALLLYVEAAMPKEMSILGKLTNKVSIPLKEKSLGYNSNNNNNNNNNTPEPRGRLGYTQSGPKSNDTAPPLAATPGRSPGRNPTQCLPAFERFTESPTVQLCSAPPAMYRVSPVDTLQCSLDNGFGLRVHHVSPNLLQILQTLGITVDGAAQVAATEIKVQANPATKQLYFTCEPRTWDMKMEVPLLVRKLCGLQASEGPQLFATRISGRVDLRTEQVHLSLTNAQVRGAAVFNTEIRLFKAQFGDSTQVVLYSWLEEKAKVTLAEADLAMLRRWGSKFMNNRVNTWLKNLPADVRSAQ